MPAFEVVVAVAEVVGLAFVAEVANVVGLACVEAVTEVDGLAVLEAEVLELSLEEVVFPLALPPTGLE